MEHCHLTFIALHKFILTTRLMHFHRYAGNGLYCAFQNYEKLESNNTLFEFQILILKEISALYCRYENSFLFGLDKKSTYLTYFSSLFDFSSFNLRLKFQL